MTMASEDQKRSTVTSSVVEEQQPEARPGNSEASNANLQFVLPSIPTRTVVGPGNVKNKGAFDWGPSGLIAYGSNSTVVVLNPSTVQVVQTLSKHTSHITKLKWTWTTVNPDVNPPSPSRHSVSGFEAPRAGVPALILAAAESTGQITIWNVSSGEAISVLQENNQPIQDMAWVKGWDHAERYLAVIHPPSHLVVWDALAGTKLWKKTYEETLLGFDFDPFRPRHLTILCEKCILFINDFGLDKAPMSNGRKFYIITPSGASPQANASNTNASLSIADESSRTRDRLRRLMKELVIGESTPKLEDSVILGECLQICYHRSIKHYLMLVYPKEVLVLDLQLQRTVGILPMDKAGSPFVQIMPCKQRDALYTLHESGAVTFRYRRGTGYSMTPYTPLEGSTPNTPGPEGQFGLPGSSFGIEVSYEQKCQSDSVRLNRNRILGCVVHPVSERKLALYLMDGRVSLYDLSSVEDGLMTDTLASLTDLLPATSKSWLNVKIPQFRFYLSGIWSGIPSLPSVIRMCPPLTFKNRLEHVPLLAIGCQSGTVQVYNAASGQMELEVASHNYPVKGIEWVSLVSFLSYAYFVTSGAQSLVRNEISLTDSRTGRVTVVRPENGEEPPIELLKASPLRQYFIVALRDSPFELWDLRTLRLLRKMPVKFPNITALEWSPGPKSKKDEYRGDTNMSISSPEEKANPLSREHVVFSDTSGQLYHIAVEGSVVKDGQRLNPQAKLQNVAAIAWKGDQLVLGDDEGQLALWELKTKTCRALPSCKCPVRKIRFAPGRGNMKVLLLHTEGVEVWDFKEMERLGHFRHARENVRVVDADWVASDRPVLACDDGSLRIMDCSLKKKNIPWLENGITEDIFSCPWLLEGTQPLLLQTFVQSQYWLPRYSLEPSLFCFLDESTAGQLKFISANVKKSLTESCSLSTARRCLFGAKLMGCVEEIDFWTVAMYYLNHYGKEKHENVEELDTCYDILCDAESYRRLQLDHAVLQETKKRTYEQTRQLARTFLLLGDKEKAASLLLHTDNDHEHFYADHLLACLVSALQPCPSVHSSVKLVATNLIAAGKVWEGAELLCLTDKVSDACRYLQTYGQWEDAAILAKLSLTPAIAVDIYKRWTDNLVSQKQSGTASLVLLSLGQFVKVIELCVAQRQYNTAALLSLACEEAGLLSKNEQNEALLVNIYCEYARLLFDWGNKEGAWFWCTKAGERGMLLRKELEFLECEH